MQEGADWYQIKGLLTLEALINYFFTLFSSTFQYKNIGNDKEVFKYDEGYPHINMCSGGPVIHATRIIPKDKEFNFPFIMFKGRKISKRLTECDSCTPSYLNSIINLNHTKPHINPY